MNSRKYAISDIHGCLITLKELLQKLGVSTDDELYFLGDYVDRGPDSKGVIDYLMELKELGYQIRTLYGNHEQMLLDEILFVNWSGGPPETTKSFGVDHIKDIDIKYINWLKGLEYYAEVGDFILVHGGLNFHMENPLGDDHDLLWMRNWYKDINYEWLGKRIIVHGHTPVDRETINSMMNNYVSNQYIDIDNGCVFKEPGLGQLACLDMNNMEIIYQKNLDGYYPIL